ncbi:hypothetical protein M0811_12534 [Anaeramoeba ignava]|uniref:Uncharacterized protein n=1 Tax=Anaeramoeba ignava TaxID=1746090 RepID=A0A9Q0LAW1_ANAIG|nr:hypothetical protein M0811_12534 [Anaeramoeba ignava]
MNSKISLKSTNFSIKKIDSQIFPQNIVFQNKKPQFQLKKPKPYHLKEQFFIGFHEGIYFSKNQNFPKFFLKSKKEKKEISDFIFFTSLFIGCSRFFNCNSKTGRIFLDFQVGSLIGFLTKIKSENSKITIINTIIGSIKGFLIGYYLRNRFKK